MSRKRVSEIPWYFFLVLMLFTTFSELNAQMQVYGL